MNDEYQLYHYTSLEVIKCIFEDYTPENLYLTFGATNCAYMNDPREISEGIDLIKDAIENISCPILKDRAKVILDCENLKDMMLIGSAISSNLGVAYAISFTRNCDNINMWRMYGNEGRGVVLGFDSNQIKSENCDLSDCIYNCEKDYDSIVNTLQEGMELFFSKLGQPLFDISQRDYDLVRSLEAIGVIAARIKNGIYSYEKGTRLITNCKTSKFRVINDILTPFTIIKLPLDSLKSIAIGPDCDKRNINTLRLFFMSKGLRHLADNIIESEIPYRN
jgi:hypothetical protein